MLRITAVINSSRTCRTLNLPNPKPAELHALGLVNGHEADDMGAGRVVLPRYIGTVGKLGDVLSQTLQTEAVWLGVLHFNHQHSRNTLGTLSGLGRLHFSHHPPPHMYSPPHIYPPPHMTCISAIIPSITSAYRCGTDELLRRTPLTNLCGVFVLT